MGACLSVVANFRSELYHTALAATQPFEVVHAQLPSIVCARFPSSAKDLQTRSFSHGRCCVHLRVMRTKCTPHLFSYSVNRSEIVPTTMTNFAVSFFAANIVENGKYNEQLQGIIQEVWHIRARNCTPKPGDDFGIEPHDWPGNDPHQNILASDWTKGRIRGMARSPGQALLFFMRQVRPNGAGSFSSVKPGQSLKG